MHLSFHSSSTPHGRRKRRIWRGLLRQVNSTRGESAAARAGSLPKFGHTGYALSSKQRSALGVPVTAGAPVITDSTTAERLS